jgi:hypothetical protein
MRIATCRCWRSVAPGDPPPWLSAANSDRSATRHRGKLCCAGAPAKSRSQTRRRRSDGYRPGGAGRQQSQSRSVEDEYKSDRDRLRLPLQCSVRPSIQPERFPKADPSSFIGLARSARPPKRPWESLRFNSAGICSSRPLRSSPDGRIAGALRCRTARPARAIPLS